MSTLLVVAGCALGLLLLLAVGVIIFMVMQAGQQRDTVSTAREGWIQRRSEKDEHNW